MRGNEEKKEKEGSEGIVGVELLWEIERDFEGSDNVEEGQEAVKKREDSGSKRISLGGIMKLVTHRRRGKTNEKGGIDASGSRLYAN